MSSPTAWVYVVDDDIAERTDVEPWLSKAGYAVRGFASGQKFLEAYPDLLPGCIVADMVMPQMSGIELQRRLLTLGCRWPVIMLTGQAAKPLVTRAMEAGIVAFLEKPVRQAELLAALIRGQAQLRGNAEVIPDPELVRRLSKLTRRERQVLDCILLQKLNKQIAAVLGVRETTVKGYRSGLMKKLGAHNMIELVVLAIRAGLYPAPRP